MIFREPLALNPVGMIVRRLTPHARTVDEQPLRPRELALCKKLFDTTFYFEQLFSVPAGVISGLVQSKPENWLNKWAFVADEAGAEARALDGTALPHGADYWPETLDHPWCIWYQRSGGDCGATRASRP